MIADTVASSVIQQLSVPVIAALATFYSANRDTLADINPMFKGDGNIVPMPPEQPTFSNREEVVQCDEEAYRKKAQSICMYSSVRLADIVSHNAQFSATIKEQQSLCRMLNHRQSNPYVAALALVLEEHVMQRQRYHYAFVSNIGNPI